MQLTSDCLITGTKQTFCSGEEGNLKFYLNGEENSQALKKIIQNGDKLLVTFGNESLDEIKKQLDKIPDIN